MCVRVCACVCVCIKVQERERGRGKGENGWTVNQISQYDQIEYATSRSRDHVCATTLKIPDQSQ